MASRNKRKNRRKAVNQNKCIYCFSHAEDVDHVPANCVLGSIDHDFIVPSCRKCNSIFGYEDEYFRTVHMFNLNPIGYENMVESAVRSLVRPKARKDLKDLVKKLQYVDCYTQSNQYIGKRACYHVEMYRVYNVINRVVRGIHFIDFGKKLELERHIVSSLVNNIPHDPKVIDAVQWSKQNSEMKYVVSPDVFSYWKSEVSDNCDSWVWVLEYYKKYQYITLVMPHRWQIDEDEKQSKVGF